MAVEAASTAVKAKSHLSKNPTKLPVRQVLRLVRRVLIFLCALLYIGLAFSATRAAVDLMRGKRNPSRVLGTANYRSMTQQVGTTTISQSPLAQDFFRGDTTPVNSTVYLEPFRTSFTRCANISATLRDMYSDGFLRALYARVVADTAYHIAAIAPSAMELVAPMVDCSSGTIAGGFATSGKFFFLTRLRSNPKALRVVVLSLANQQYRIPSQQEYGPAAVASLHVVDDVRATHVDHYMIVSIGYPLAPFRFRVYDYVSTTASGEWRLQGVPAGDDELSKTLYTSSRSGFFIKSESEQSNVNSLIWAIEKADPRAAIARWTWVSTPVLRDSWAWVHGLQFFLGGSVLANLLVLLVATYRNFRLGKLWIGDAFVSLSTSQMLNGMLVFVSWFMNEFWSLHEFCFHLSREVSELETITIYEDHVRADLLTLYMSACGLIGTLLHERIDPLIAVACFFIGYEGRVAIIKLFPAVAREIKAYSFRAYMKGMQRPLAGQEAKQRRMSPMQLYTPVELDERSSRFVLACLFPVLLTLLLVILYATARK
ncbi:hypothetical protein ATCC90586_008716 [Pythium insidiosum]|nr:hypothetical protein ATCC90586_008716 [Pythium insidiosum]